MRIHVVENNAHLNEIIVKKLKLENYNVVTCLRGKKQTDSYRALNEICSARGCMKE